MKAKIHRTLVNFGVQQGDRMEKQPLDLPPYLQNGP
tara:strand:+ start:4985 stop:5092 length:108 start_codon:yes stop_codon:yes gene_type:complete